MNNFEKSNSSSYRKQPQKYSGLMSSIIKGKVKKEIFEIRKQKNLAAQKILDQFEEKLVRNLNRSPSDNSDPHLTNFIQKGSEISFDELLLKLLRSNRRSWEMFLIHLAENCDVSALSCFGTNLLYGGLMTSTFNNSPRCRFADFSSKLTSKDVVDLQNAIKNDLREDRRICIIRGYNLLNDNFIQLCRYFADTAFILIDREPSRPLNYAVYNILYIPESVNTVPVANANNSLLYGISYFIPGEINTETTRDTNISSVFKFLSAPLLPIRSTANDFYGAICHIEALLSEGKNRSPVIHCINQ